MRARTSFLLAMATVVALSACSRDDTPTGLAGAPIEARVFTDNFISADFQAFAGSKLDAVSIDNTTKYRGSASLKITIPDAGQYAGGAFVASVARDLSRYDALTFYARASTAATLNTAGIANDNSGTSKYMAERSAIALTTAWQKYTIPIPDSDKLTAEKGLFYFAEGPEGATGYDIWIDDLRFETLGTITNPRPAIASTTINAEVGATQQLPNIPVTFAVAGADVTLSAMPGYFSFATSNSAVATVNADGLVNVVGSGDANITATLAGTPATGAVTIAATAPPTAGPATPTEDAADVISLFSGAYTNRTVDTWSAVWDAADVTDVTLGGNAAKRYANFVFAGIEFTSAPVDISAMTHFHMDVYVSNPTAFSVKLVDFGADGVFGGGNDTEAQVSFSPASTPAMVAGSWVSIDIPLTSFAAMTGREHVAQMILAGSSATTYIDNVYFYAGAAPPPPAAPSVAAPTPAYAASDVVSLFSNAYTNVAVGTWSAGWDAADVADVQVAGNDTKHYTNLTFAGIEFTSPTVNGSAMTHFRMDIWTPDAVTAPAAFKIKLVDFGANGVFGGGDDVEHELTFTAASSPALVSGDWFTLDIPFSSFTNLTTRGNLAQLIIVGDDPISTVFIDNVLLHR